MISFNFFILCKQYVIILLFFSELAKLCRLSVNNLTLDSSNTKTHLLLQAHFSRLHLPCTDYLTDTKSVLDQTIRIIQVH